MVTTAQMALYEKLSTGWTTINYIVDFLFFLDILLIFNTAIINEDGQIIEDRTYIAKTYLKGWFFIDFVAILPFELMIPSGGESANVVRFARIGRLFKMLKLMKLLRIMKL